MHFDLQGFPISFHIDDKHLKAQIRAIILL